MFKEFHMSKSIPSPNDRYYEAILQLRPFDKEVFKYVQDQLSRNPHVFVSKYVEKKEGIDLYLSSKRFAKTVGQKLKRRFYGGIVKMAQKLYSRDRLRSKEVYRLTVLFRCPVKVKQQEEN